MKKTRSLLVVFENRITQAQLPQFRGAIIRRVGGDDMFHNHEGEGYHYRYPLVQYRVVRGRAALWAIGEGVERVGKVIDAGADLISIGGEEQPLRVAEVRPMQRLVQVWDGSFDYRLRGWLPLNGKNYVEYREQPSVAERVRLLERILTGNMLSMCKGLGIVVERTIECTITWVSEAHKCHYKNVPMMSFDVVFTCNLSLPAYIGLGIGVSMGYGVCTPIYEQSIKQG